MGGKISLKSTAGVGSHFYFEVNLSLSSPVRKRKALNSSPVEQEEPLVKKSESSLTLPSLR